MIDSEVSVLVRVRRLKFCQDAETRGLLAPPYAVSAIKNTTSAALRNGGDWTGLSLTDNSIGIGSAF